MTARLLACALAAAVLPFAPAASAAGSESVAGWCTFTGSTTPDGLMQYAYGGRAVATSTSARPPEETVLTCTIESPAQGLPGEAPTLTRSITVAGVGPTAAAADTTPAWPVRPVRVCVSGYAVFDPVMPVQVPIDEQCRASTV
jgi:hypothetical protein